MISYVWDTLTRWLDYLDNHPKIYNTVIFFGILAIAYFLAKAVRRVFGSFLRKKTLHHTDTTHVNFLKNVSQGAIFLLGFGLAVYSIPPLRALSVSLLTGAGILAAVIGLAAQQTFSNFVSGVFIVLFKPIRVNDYVEIDSKYFGTVEDITLRHTVIRNLQGVRIVIPNSVLSSAIVVNYHLTDINVCALVELLVEYGQDLDLITQTVQETALLHPLTIDHRTEEEKQKGLHPVRVRTIRANERGILLRVYIWGRNPDDSYDLRTDLTKIFVEELLKKGVKFSELKL